MKNGKILFALVMGIVLIAIAFFNLLIRISPVCLIVNIIAKGTDKPQSFLTADSIRALKYRFFHNIPLRVGFRFMV